MTTIQVLGTGCRKCVSLKANVEAALKELGLEAEIEKLLPQLNFSDEDGDRLVSSFSGGWQMRMGLGKIMLQSPDLLLLDEPTNHLDLETIEWLEKYLVVESGGLHNFDA